MRRKCRSFASFSMLVVMALLLKGENSEAWQRRLLEQGAIFLAIEHLYWVYLRRPEAAPECATAKI